MVNICIILVNSPRSCWLKLADSKTSKALSHANRLPHNLKALWNGGRSSKKIHETAEANRFNRLHDLNKRGSFFCCSILIHHEMLQRICKSPCAFLVSVLMSNKKSYSFIEASSFITVPWSNWYGRQIDKAQPPFLAMVVCKLPYMYVRSKFDLSPPHMVVS